ncbi:MULTISPECIES: HU family DNA-binding protein [Capnocytophaga]|uniref:DNA-binding protein HU 2 n=1 Tax=Capnocytophaga canis TaxID=1848903 RepID=A0A0B7ILS2_9FLAO|nr:MULTISPECIES: HU family DNA-binding protein [Capnocytophaga]GJQ04008.1 integration host factor subunit beta [Capnocytophaga canimorsus]CEN52800.1 DNA-binding protein HU 2 [Capnocytophaga canis]
MNKSELIRKVAERSEVSIKETSKIVEFLFQEISEGLKNEDVIIKDFGTFKKSIRKARKGRNPNTGEILNIPEKEVVSFKPSKNILRYKWL